MWYVLLYMITASLTTRMFTPDNQTEGLLVVSLSFIVFFLGAIYDELRRALRKPKAKE